MTDPIKLPPDPLVTMNKATLDRQIAYAVERATADLRAELASVLSDWNDIVKAIGSPTNGGAIGHAKSVLARAQKAEAERDEVRAELARLTTLRPASEWDGDLAIWRYRSHPRYLVSDKDCETYDLIGWTPLPPVKEST